MKNILPYILVLLFSFSMIANASPEVQVENIEYSIGEKILTLQSGQVDLKATLKNTTLSPKEGFLFMMLYSKIDNSLMTVSNGRLFSILANESLEISDKITVPSTANMILKTYIWNSLDGMSEYISPITLEPINTPPTMPQNLTSVSPYYSKVALKWDASRDNLRVCGYIILRDGIEIARTAETEYTDTSVTEDTEYEYQVCAYDDSGDISEAAKINVKTLKRALGSIDFTTEIPTATGDLTLAHNTAASFVPNAFGLSGCRFSNRSADRLRVLLPANISGNIIVEIKYYDNTTGTIRVAQNGSAAGGSLPQGTLFDIVRKNTETWKTETRTVYGWKYGDGTTGISIYPTQSDNAQMYIASVSVYQSEE